MEALTLHTYFRSSASFRVRIALELKGLSATAVPVHLLRDGGEQLGPAFRALNPAALVPVLEHAGARLTQSLAIIEYLEELVPEPNLIGRTPLERARVRAFALDIACEIHPLDNLRVLKYLTHTLGVEEEGKNAWYRHWVETGLAALEQRIENDDSRSCGGSGSGESYCLGDRPTLADCCLVPQILNAQRFGCRLDHVPRLTAIHDHCMTLPAFQRAAPAAQADAA